MASLLTDLQTSMSRYLAISWQLSLIHTTIVLLVLLAYRRFCSPIANIPGPFWASVSRLWFTKHAIAGDQNVEITNLHEKYGHFVRIADNEVSVTHPDAIKELLLGPVKKGVWYTFFAFPDPRYQSAFSTVDPARKAEITRNYSAGFSLSNIIKNEDAIDDTVMLFLDRVVELSKTGKPVDLDKWITFCAFDLMGEVLFSKKFGYLEEGIDVGNSIANNQVLSKFGASAAHHGSMRLLNRLVLGNPLISRTGILPMGHIVNTCMKNLAEREKNDDSRFDMVAHWYRSYKKHSDRISLIDYHAQVTSVLGAGGETVSCALQSFVYHMIRTPGMWERARDEIDAACAKGMCGDGVISYADAVRLPFLAASLKEALRIHTPVAWNLPRTAGKNGISIGGHKFPEGVTLSANAWVFHYSKEYWGEDAHEFRPDRWLAEDIGQREKYFFPWGAGPNSCPGQHLARVEIAKVAATLVRDYNISLVDPKHTWEWKAHFTMVPRNWPVFIEKREAITVAS